jgi:hypothetical protein
MSTLVVQISWSQPAITAGITGYNIYLVSGAPESATKTLLAFNSGVGNTTYNYSGEDGVQYQFEVRATDGTNESPAIEIFYPTGTTLYTPTALTPTGNPMMTARDTQYLTAAEYVTYATGTGVTTTSALYTSGVLDVYLEAASEQVNRYCRRHFQTQTIDEIYQGVRIGLDSPKLVTIPLNEGPIQNVNRIDIQVLKWFITFDLSYLQVNPEGNFIQLTPFLGGGASGIPLPSAALVEGLLGKVWVNYTAGYNVIPNAVKLATSLYATKLIGMQENPVSAQAVKFGRNFTLQWDRDVDPIIVQANRLLDPYRLSTWRTP